MSYASRHFYVYIMASKTHVLYVGVTNNLIRRVYEHKHKLHDGFTSRFNVTRLVYYEETGDIRNAIAAEKIIKAWRRAKKLALIEEFNPRWEDLSDGWFNEEGEQL
jgi:putative endonuclease